MEWKACHCLIWISSHYLSEGPTYLGICLVSTAPLSSVHSLQSKQNEATFPHCVRTKDLNIYSSFSYQTSWEIMNILANILFDSRNHWGLTRISIFHFPLRPTFAGRWQHRSPGCWTLLMFTQTFMTSKTCRAHLDVYGPRIKEPGLKLTYLIVNKKQYFQNVIVMLFIFIFFDKSFDSFDEQHKNHFNPDTRTMTRSHPKAGSKCENLIRK